MRIEPDRRTRAVHAGEPCEHAERERVVAAEHDDHLVGALGTLDGVGDLARDRHDASRYFARGSRDGVTSACGTAMSPRSSTG